MLYLQTIYLTFYQYDCWIRLNFLFLSLLYIYYIKFFLKSQLRNFQGSGLSSTFSGLILRASGHKSLIKQALFILIWSWLPSDKFAVWALFILMFFSFFFFGDALCWVRPAYQFLLYWAYLLSVNSRAQFWHSVPKWWTLRVPPPPDFLCAKQMTTLCSPKAHRLTLCVTDKAFATPNSVLTNFAGFVLVPRIDRILSAIAHRHSCFLVLVRPDLH